MICLQFHTVVSTSMITWCLHFHSFEMIEMNDISIEFSILSVIPIPTRDVWKHRFYETHHKLKYKNQPMNEVYIKTMISDWKHNNEDVFCLVLELSSISIQRKRKCFETLLFFPEWMATVTVLVIVIQSIFFNLFWDLRRFRSQKRKEKKNDH